MKPLYLLATLAFVTPLPVTAIADQCVDGNRADNYPAWEYIVDNAARTADDYAVTRNPAATFVMAEVAAIYQFGGEDKGSYLIRLIATNGRNTDFAMLRPNFDFCTNPASLDDAQTDLFTVVTAKHNGKAF